MKKPESKLQELVTRLQQACGENLVSIVLYGSAAREDFHEQFSDVNVLVVLQHLQPSSFAPISAVLRWWSHEEKLRPPMIMTLEELRESADVFAIELLDIQRSHKTLFGQDVVDGNRCADEPAPRRGGTRAANDTAAAAPALAAES